MGKCCDLLRCLNYKPTWISLAFQCWEPPLPRSRLQNFACALCQQQRLATEEWCGGKGGLALWHFPKRATKASEFRQETGDVVVSVAFCLMSRRSGDQGWVSCQQDCALQTEGTDFNKSQRLLTHKRFLVWKDYCTWILSSEEWWVVSYGWILKGVSETSRCRCFWCTISRCYFGWRVMVFQSLHISTKNTLLRSQQRRCNPYSKPKDFQQPFLLTPSMPKYVGRTCFAPRHPADMGEASRHVDVSQDDNVSHTYSVPLSHIKSSISLKFCKILIFSEFQRLRMLDFPFMRPWVFFPKRHFSGRCFLSSRISSLLPWPMRGCQRNMSKQHEQINAKLAI